MAPDVPLAALAAQLRGEHAALDPLSGGDPATDLRAVFSWSYHTLRPATARTFRLLGVHPGPDITAAAAASLCGVPADQAAVALAELSDASLVAEQTPGRFALHDLLRAYASELAHQTGPEPDSAHAQRRVLDHYLHTAHAAALLLNPSRDPIELAPPGPGVAPEPLADHADALAWFTAEHSVLLAIVARARAAGMGIHVGQLGWTLTNYLQRAGHWTDQLDVQGAALEAARRRGDRPGQAVAHRSLAGAYVRTTRYTEAARHLRLAITLYRKLGDDLSVAHVQMSLADVFDCQGDPGKALDAARQSHTLYRSAGHRIGEARAMVLVGYYLGRLGEHRRALATCEQALTLLCELGDRSGQAGTLASIGYAHDHLGHPEQAITCYHRARDLYHELGDRYYEADTLAKLGDAYIAVGDRTHARHAWQQAHEIMQELGHPDAMAIAARLSQSEALTPTD
jgi:tetratricopeptide (TPR) repeat protein